MSKLLLLTLILLSVISFQAISQNLYEADYQDAFIELIGGTPEVQLYDNTRCDILYDGCAIEVDFAVKWAEAIGQSLYYAAVLGKTPGIILIIKSDSDYRYLYRLLSVFVYIKQEVRVWVISHSADTGFDINVIIY